MATWIDFQTRLIYGTAFMRRAWIEPRILKFSCCRFKANVFDIAEMCFEVNKCALWDRETERGLNFELIPDVGEGQDKYCETMNRKTSKTPVTYGDQFRWQFMQVHVFLASMKKCVLFRGLNTSDFIQEIRTKETENWLGARSRISSVSSINDKRWVNFDFCISF